MSLDQLLATSCRLATRAAFTDQAAPDLCPFAHGTISYLINTS
jgi:hypothetical protein